MYFTASLRRLITALAIDLEFEAAKEASREHIPYEVLPESSTNCLENVRNGCLIDWLLDYVVHKCNYVTVEIM